MPSVAYHHWRSRRAAALDEIENAHRSVGGSRRGRRYATQQLNQAYAVLLSSQFQAHCRDLHTECVTHLVTTVTPAFQSTVSLEFSLNRKIDRGNPTPGNLGADFGRLGIDFWSELLIADPRNAQRQQLLDELIAWRNAIAHQDFAAMIRRGVRPVLQLSQVQHWRKACTGLVRSFDRVLGAYILRTTGNTPW